jgi:hypothetical protein
MSEVNTNELKRAVENQHGCTATVLQSVPVKETFDDKTVGWLPRCVDLSCGPSLRVGRSISRALDRRYGSGIAEVG